ncbi:RNase H domain-containing protein [Trichonephila clavipes]|nr:RNase H domain-containing protein [Trichonephila clavipes]
MLNLSDFKRIQIVGARLAGASMAKTSQFLGYTRGTVSKVMTKYTQIGKTRSAKKIVSKKGSSVKETDGPQWFPADLYETFPILEQAKCLVIFCDSKAVLQAILNRGSWITKEICSRLFRLQEFDKVYFLQWLPAHVDITDKKNMDKLAKEARNLNNDNFVNVTLLDANIIANFKLREKSIPVKHRICIISENHLITKATAKLKIGNHKGMKIDKHSRTCRNCDNSLDTELTPAHIFNCPAIVASLQIIGLLVSSANFYRDNIEQNAGTVIWAHGTVYFGPIKDTISS